MATCKEAKPRPKMSRLLPQLAESKPLKTLKTLNPEEACQFQLPMSNLPPELLFDILSRLPPKDLIRYLCVSKYWYALIHDQRFMKTHLQRAIETKSSLTILLREYNPDQTPLDFFSLPFNDDETFVKPEQPLNSGERTEILGSIHGLVCIQNDADKSIALWNPSIQKFKKIPPTTFDPKKRARYGFGYDSVNDDYKIVGIMNFLVAGYQVQIYSLKSNSWKRIQSMPCNCFAINLYYNVAYLNDALSWLLYDESVENRYIILTLDLAGEKYRQFPTPIVKYRHDQPVVVVLGGHLCICVSHFEIGHDVWIMKEYGVTQSWTLLYSIEEEAVPSVIDHICKPLVFSKNDKMVLLTNDYDVLFWYDLEKKSVKKVDSRGWLRTFEMTTVCMESLCLLDGDPVIVGGRHQQFPYVSL